MLLRYNFSFKMKGSKFYGAHGALRNLRCFTVEAFDVAWSRPGTCFRNSVTN